jgi:hypothetical protein
MATATQSGINGVMTLAEFESTPAFLACSEKQRRWLQTLVTNGGDSTAATLAAFGCSSPRNARLFGYAVRKQTHIVAALNVYLGKSDRDIEIESEKAFMKRVDKVAANRNVTVAQIDALRFQGRAHGWIVSERLPNTHGHVPKVEADDDDEPAETPKADSKAPAAPAPKAQPPAARVAPPAPAAAPEPFVGQIVTRRYGGSLHYALIWDIDPATGHTQDIDVTAETTDEKRAEFAALVAALPKEKRAEFAAALREAAAQESALEPVPTPIAAPALVEKTFDVKPIRSSTEWEKLQAGRPQ